MTILEILENQVISLRSELSNTRHVLGLVIRHALEKSDCLVANEESALEDFGVYEILVSTEKYQKGTKIMVMRKCKYLSSCDWAKAMWGKIKLVMKKETPLNNIYECVDREGRISSITHKHFIDQATKQTTND